MKNVLTTLGLLFAMTFATTAFAAPAVDETEDWSKRPNRDAVRGLIVKMRNDVTGQSLAAGAAGTDRLGKMSQKVGMTLRDERLM